MSEQKKDKLDQVKTLIELIQNRELRLEQYARTCDLLTKGVSFRIRVEAATKEKQTEMTFNSLFDLHDRAIRQAMGVAPKHIEKEVQNEEHIALNDAELYLILGILTERTKKEIAEYTQQLNELL